MRRRRTVEEELRHFARLQVRAGLTDEAGIRREVAEAIGAELPGVDAEVLARAWLAAELAALRAEQEGWPEVTDHDRLVAVFAELDRRGIRVLPGVPDHWAAMAQWRTAQRETAQKETAQKETAQKETAQKETAQKETAQKETAQREQAPNRGVAWFTPADVWHAVDHGMLEVNLWHGDGANVAPGDTLLTEALSCFAAHDLPAHFAEGRIEVAAHWQRRSA